MKLSREQQNEIRRLQVAYRFYLREAAQIDWDANFAKELKKQPILQQIKEAGEMGIPIRQIHLAMDMKQVSSLEKFISPPSNPLRVKDLVEKIEVYDTPEKLVAEVKVLDTIVELGMGDYEIMNADGDLVRFHDWDFDGYHIINFKNDNGNANVTATQKRQIFERWPDAVIGFEVREDRFGNDYMDRGEELNE